jgi:phosphate/phosphite/phosphonate ABC transporter binding protein
MPIKSFITTVSLLLLSACATTDDNSEPSLKKTVMETPLAVGITAPISIKEAKKDALQLEALFTESLGEPVSVTVYPTYDDLVNSIVSGVLDLAWMPPLAYVKARRQAMVIPIRKAVRAGHASYKSVLFTKIDSSMTSPADLKGTKVGWVSKLSSSGYLFPRVLLMDAGIDPDGLFAEEKFYKGHLAVCKAVASGEIDVGATFTDDIFEQVPKSVSACSKMGVFPEGTFKVLSATAEVPSDVVVARVGLPPMMIKSVSTALDALSNKPNLRALLGRTLDADGFMQVGLADYLSVEHALEVLEAQ